MWVSAMMNEMILHIGKLVPCRNPLQRTRGHLMRINPTFLPIVAPYAITFHLFVFVSIDCLWVVAPHAPFEKLHVTHVPYYTGCMID
jgi:hypothetical protein